MQPAKNNKNTTGSEHEPRPGHPRENEPDEAAALPSTRPDDCDQEQILFFLGQVQELEQALLRAGYTRASRTPGTAQADWTGFARHIEDRFDPDSSPVLQAAVAHLLWAEENRELRDERLEDSDPWKNASPHNDIVWLSELIQQTRNRVARDLMFPARPGYDYSNVSAAMFVLDAWAQLDRKVAALLVQVRRRGSS